MHILRIWLSLLALAGSFSLLNGQQHLSLEKAIQKTLQNNYSIRIRQFDTDIRARQVDPSLVGRSPVLDFNASYNLGWSDANIETLPLGPGPESNEPLQLDGINNEVFISPEVSLLLFDGQASKYRLEQLQANSDLARLQQRQTMEQAVGEVMVAYLEVARQQSLMTTTRQSIELNQDRLARAEQDAAYGTSSSLEALQIEVDLKTDSARLRDLRLQYDNARRNLNYILGESLETSYQVDTSVNVNAGLELAELESQMINNNTTLQLSQKGIELAGLDVQVRKAAFKPTLQGYANVNFLYQQNDANFLQSNRVWGPNVGLRLNYPIFDGGARKIQEETAVLEQEKSQLEQISTQDQLTKELYNAYATYRNTMEQLRIEKSNLKVFETNLENVQNLYTLGQATNTDVRAAQVNLNAAKNRIKNFQYTIKQAEVALYLLTGQLVQ